MWPQWTYLILNLIGIGLVISNHGKPRTNENAYAWIISALIQFFILFKGGFFNGFFKP